MLSLFGGLLQRVSAACLCVGGWSIEGQALGVAIYLNSLPFKMASFILNIIFVVLFSSSHFI